MRKLVVFALLAAALTTVTAMPAAARPRGTNGKIAINADNLVTGQEQVYTVDPDGTDRRPLANDTESGQWSPDGTKLLCCGGILDVDSGGVVPMDADFLLTLYPDRLLFCGTWSPDGARLACEGGFLDPSLQGVYTIRSSDGGDLQQVTSNPGGDDCQGDYSPNGKQIVFLRTAYPDVFALFTVKLDGKGLDKGLRQITPDGMELNFNCGNWSPQGNDIVFSAHVPATDRGTIWVVHSDGSGLHRIPIPGCGGPSNNPTSAGCSQPSWSPDGKRILFSRQQGFGQSDDYTVNADGSDPFQLTNTPDISEGGGDWGTHPVTP